MKLEALDLFCGGGGGARGLIQAGFEVTGIDADPRCAESYPGRFLQADLSVGALPEAVERFDLVWASPPCQRFTFGNNATPEVKGTHPDFIELTRRLLARARFSVIENVPGAPIRHDLALVGPMFGLNRIRRLRYFELSFFCLQPIHINDIKSSKPVVTVLRSCAFYQKAGSWSNRNSKRRQYVPAATAREVMGIPPGEMSRAEVGEAVPPAYAYFIGSQVRRIIEGGALA